MRIFWEKLGVLGPVYRLVGQGFSDRDIAKKLNLTELSVQACLAWILHFLGFTNRNELIRYAATPTTTCVWHRVRTLGGQTPSA